MDQDTNSWSALLVLVYCSYCLRMSAKRSEFLCGLEESSTELHSWTRIITKSTDRWKEVVRTLSESRIPGLATQYVPLRNHIVGEKMKALWNFWFSTPHIPVGSVTQQEWTVPQASLAQPATWSELNFEPILEDFTLEQYQFHFE